jgi:hypothetical protein
MGTLVTGTDGLTSMEWIETTVEFPLFILIDDTGPFPLPIKLILFANSTFTTSDR